MSNTVLTTRRPSTQTRFSWKKQRNPNTDELASSTLFYGGVEIGSITPVINRTTKITTGFRWSAGNNLLGIDEQSSGRTPISTLEEAMTQCREYCRAQLQQSYS